MSKIKESELEFFFKRYENKKVIEIEFDENLEGKISLEEATIKFDDKTGFLIIKGKRIFLKINGTLVYRYEELNNELEIELEGLKLKIK